MDARPDFRIPAGLAPREEIRLNPNSAPTRAKDKIFINFLNMKILEDYIVAVGTGGDPNVVPHIKFTKESLSYVQQLDRMIEEEYCPTKTYPDYHSEAFRYCHDAFAPVRLVGQSIIRIARGLFDHDGCLDDDEMNFSAYCRPISSTEVAKICYTSMILDRRLRDNESTERLMALSRVARFDCFRLATVTDHKLGDDINIDPTLLDVLAEIIAPYKQLGHVEYAWVFMVTWMTGFNIAIAKEVLILYATRRHYLRCSNFPMHPYFLKDCMSWSEIESDACVIMTDGGFALSSFIWMIINRKSYAEFQGFQEIRTNWRFVNFGALPDPLQRTYLLYNASKVVGQDGEYAEETDIYHVRPGSLYDSQSLRGTMDLEHSIVLAMRADYAVVVPWNYETRIDRVNGENIMYARRNNSDVWLRLILFMSMVSAGAAATPVDEPVQKSSWLWVFVAGLIMTAFVELMKIASPRFKRVLVAAMTEDSERSVPELKGYGAKYSSTRKFQEPPTEAPDNEISMETRSDRMDVRDSHNMSAFQVQMLMYRLEAELVTRSASGIEAPIYRRTIEESLMRKGPNYLRAERAAINKRMREDYVFREKLVTAWADGRLSTKWAHEYWIPVILTRRASLISSGMPGLSTKAVSVIRDKLSEHVRYDSLRHCWPSFRPKIVTGSLFGSVDEYLTHPVCDIIMTVQRALLTPWTSGTSTIAQVSVASDIAIALLKLYKIIPDVRKKVMTYFLKTLWPSIGFQDPEKDLASKGLLDVFTGLGEWDKMKEGTKWIISQILSFVALSPTMWGLWDGDKTFYETVKECAFDMKKHKLLNTLIDGFFSIAENALVVVGAGPMAGMFDRSCKPLEEAYSHAVTATNEYCVTGEGDEFRLTDEVEDLKERFKAARSKASRLSHETYLTERVKAVEGLLTRIYSVRSSQQKHYCPLVYGLSGKAGIGKSVGLDAVIDVHLQTIGVAKRKGMISEVDKYHSNITPATTYACIDDVGKDAEKYIENTAGSILIYFCTSEPVLLIKAEVEGKGVMYSNLVVMGVTGNKLGLNLSRGITDTPAVRRRVIEFWAEVDDTKAEEVDDHWEPKEKLQVPEPTHLKFWLVRDEAEGCASEPQKVGDPLTWDELQEFVKRKAARHHQSQMRIVGTPNSSKERCGHNRYKVNCALCRDVKFQFLGPKTKVKVLTQVDTRLWELLDGYWPLDKLSDDELIEFGTGCVVWGVVYLSLSLLALLITGNLLPFAVNCLLFLRQVMAFVAYSATKQKQEHFAAPVEQVTEAVVESGFTNLACASIAGASVPMIIMALRSAKKRFQEPPDEAPDPEESSKDVIEPVVKTATDIKTGQMVAVSEVKDVLKHEALVSKLIKDYWCPPVRDHPISQAGSGASDESLCDLVEKQTFFFVEAEGTCKRRMAVQVKPGIVWLPTHYLTRLKHGAMYRAMKSGMPSTPFRYDAEAVVSVPNKDVSFMRTKELFGRCVDLTKYFSNDFKFSSELQGLQVYPSDRLSYKTGRQTVTVTIAPKDTMNVMGVDINGIFRKTTTINSTDGDCAGVVIVNKTIIGFHSWGEMHPTTEGSGGGLIERKLVEACLHRASPNTGSNEGPVLELETSLVEFAKAHPKNPTNFIGTHSPIVAYHLRRDFSHKTSLETNPYADFFINRFNISPDIKFAPAKGTVNEVSHRMLSIAGANRGEGLFSEFRRATDHYLEGVEDVVAGVLARNPTFARRPLGITEAVFGIVDHKYAKAVDKSKSAGALLGCKKGRFILEHDPESKTGYLRNDFERDLLNFRTGLLMGKRTGVLGKMHGKDEALPFKTEVYLKQFIEVLKEKRGFIGVSFFMQVLLRMYLGPAMDVMQDAHLWFGNSVGIDPGGPEWHELWQFLTEGEKRLILSLDFSKFDLTHCAALDEVLAYLFTKVCKCLGYDPEELSVVQILCAEMCAMWIDYGGPVVISRGIWPSGINPTAIGGAFKVIIFLVVAFLRDHKTKKFREEIRANALGDDNAHAARGDCPIAIETIVNLAKEIGMEVTSDDKDSEIVKKSLDDASYLSRTTWMHPELGRLVGKLALKSMYRPFLVWHKNKRPLEMMTDICTGTMRELALHGREEYERHQLAMFEFFEERKWPVPLTVAASYDDYIEAMQVRESKKSYRYKFQSDDDFDADGGTHDAVEVREVEETGDHVENPILDRAEMSGYRHELDTRKLPPYVEREIYIASYTLANNGSFTVRINPLVTITSSDKLISRLDSYHAISFDLEVRLAVTGTKFHYGLMMAYVIYAPDETIFQQEATMTKNFRRLLGSQRRPVYFEIGKDENIAILRIPFVFHHAMLRLTVDEVSKYCQVVIESVTPVRCGVDDAPSEASLAVYARMSKVYGIGHTPVGFQNMTPEEGRSKPSSIIGRAARLADAASRIPGLSLPFQIASGVLHATSDLARACGFSKPVLYDSQGYVPFASPPTASANTDVAGRVLSYDVHQGVALRHTLVPHGGVEELSIKHLVSIPAIIRVGTIPPASNDYRVPWLSVNVTPAMELYSGNDRLLTPQGLVASMRRYWHGTMCYRLRILTTALTGGKIMASYNANGPEPISDFEVLDNTVWDLKAQNCLEVRVNWMSPENFLVTFGNGAAGAWTTYSTERHNGCLMFSTMQQIVGTRTDQEIDYVLEAWMENEIFFNPDYCLYGNRTIVDMETEPPDIVQAPVIDPRAYTPILDGDSTLVTNAPTPPIGEESDSQAPTRAPVLSTILPTRAQRTNTPSVTASRMPTRRPSAPPVTLPTTQPSNAATPGPTSAPTASDGCNVQMQDVPFEWFVSTQAYRVNTNRTFLKQGTHIFRALFWHSPGGIATSITLRYTTGRRPEGVGVSISGVDLVGNIFITAPSDPSLDGHGFVDFTITVYNDMEIIATTAALPESYEVIEAGPNDMAALGVPGSLVTETVDGVDLQAWETGPFITSIDESINVASCGMEAGAGSVAFRGRMVTPPLDGSNPGYHLAAHLGQVRFAPRTRVFAFVYTRVRPQFQGPGDDFLTFEIGRHLDTHTDLIQVHAGEDIVSLRQDLRIMRPSYSLTTPGERDISIPLHNAGSPVLTPLNVLQHSFAFQRGGMLAWYKIFGDGSIFVQRGPTCHGERAFDYFTRGYEYADSRVNPSILVSYPWFARQRYDYARSSQLRDGSNRRSVMVRPSATSPTVTITEDLAVGEDYSLMLFMGAPVMRV